MHVLPRRAPSKRWTLLAVLACLGTACADQEAIEARKEAESDRDEATAKLSRANASLAEAEKALTAVKSTLEEHAERLAAATAENEKLKQTARYHFDQAVSKSQASDDDAGNKGAIEAYQAFLAKFPNDALAEVSAQRIEALEKRIEERAKKLEKDQSAVRKLIAACRKGAKDAKEKAQKLLGSVPDPDGTLAKEINGCDDTD